MKTDPLCWSKWYPEIYGGLHMIKISVIWELKEEKLHFEMQNISILINIFNFTLKFYR